MMVIPHVLIHTPNMFFQNGVFYLDGSVPVTIVMLSLIFGLPFALLKSQTNAKAYSFAKPVGLRLWNFSYMKN